MVAEAMYRWSPHHLFPLRWIIQESDPDAYVLRNGVFTISIFHSDVRRAVNLLLDKYNQNPDAIVRAHVDEFLVLARSRGEDFEQKCLKYVEQLGRTPPALRRDRRIPGRPRPINMEILYPRVYE
jgi:hypothetical protein